MITEFAQRISSRLGRQLNSRNLSGHHPVKLLEVKPLFSRLSPVEVEFISLAVTGSLGQAKTDCRTLIMSFPNHPGVPDSGAIYLRLKGVYPEAVDGKVKRYDQGQGFVPVLLEPADGCKIIARQERADNEYSAAGTMSAERLQVEVETAEILGPEISDELLGFGLYDNLSFNSQPVGFAYYAMDRSQDNRLLHVLRSASELPFTEHHQEAARQVGRLLRAMHDRGLAHRYPHLGNYTWSEFPWGVKLVDLDTAVKLAGLPKETQLAWLYLDLSRTIVDFYATILNGEPGRYHGTTMVKLLPQFFRGYFQRAVNLLPGMPVKLSELSKADFTALVDNSLYWRPRYLAEQNLGHPVDLQAYAAQTPDFQPFWQALTSVVETIR